MLKGLTRILGGDPVRRQIEAYGEIVERINQLEPQIKTLSDEALGAKTEAFKARLAQGETLDDLLVEAFAVVREAAVRTVGLRPYDVQLIGGVVLHEGKIAEMKTGEGKTLVATMPIYLNALTGRGVHLVTVNDYLARRDARWMGPVFHLLGLSVGVLQEAARTEGGKKALLYDPARESSQEDMHQLQIVDRKLAYQADVVYGTNNEFGFDYLRDNMARSLEARVQREHHYAILDEVDNILIDEARTPLIISGPSREDPELYEQMARVVKQLAPEDFEVSERDRTVALTEIGEDHVEQILGTTLRDPDRPEDITPEQARILGHIEQALRAEHLFTRNKDYVVQSGRVIIVDEFTGRMMPGRRWSDGLHQAVEAKEGARVRQENVTYATITLQNYFRMYEKLAGMTGTAVTESEEFNKIYDVDVLPLPTNLEYVAMQPDTDLEEVEYSENGNTFTFYARTDDPEQNPVFWKRKDYPDVVYRTLEAKLRAVTLEILRRHIRGQPLLVGTTSVELSERLSSRLRAKSLRRLAMVEVLRDAYLEAYDIPADGIRVEALEPLNMPLNELRTGVMRPIAKDIELPLNPTRPENIQRLRMLLGSPTEHEDQLAKVLNAGISHNVLNAKKHDEESRIIADAGALGAVTIATNMAGRGVDIKLGGEIAEEVLATVNRVLRRGGVEDPENLNMVERLEALDQLDPETIGIYDAEIDLYRKFMQDGVRVKEAGGLHVIGSERHEARRIDNQLRGRAARQGDPGSSQFFLSLEDELMRLFGGSQVSNLMQRLNIDDSVPIAHGIVNRTIEQAQTRVEGANFDTRKHLLEYDDVLNQQREIFYGQRNRVFTKEDFTEDLAQMLEVEVERHVQTALIDPEGPWKLLAWLEETQPTLDLQSQDPYPSFMLRLLLDSLEPHEEAQDVRDALIAIAEQALDSQHVHLTVAVENQVERAVERLEEQVMQRVETAETAVEAAMFEAQDAGREVDLDQILRLLENATGMRIKISDENRESIRTDPQSLQRNIPALIEGSLGLRVWAGLVQSVERRIGESLNLEARLSPPIDWEEATDHLFEAIERTWTERRARILKEIRRELKTQIGQEGEVDEMEKLQALVRMSYGTRTVFDQKTHRKRSVMVPRLSYAFSTAELIASEEPEYLTQEVLAYLQGAQDYLRRKLGQAEVIRQGANGIEDLDEGAQRSLRRTLGADAFEEARSAGQIVDLPDSLKEVVGEALGDALLTGAYRNLILSVGDRLWVDYLTQMEALRTSIGLEAYGQRDPLVQYKSRAFDMFNQLLDSIRAGVVARMFRLRTPAQAQAAPSAPTGRAAVTRPGDGRKAASRKKSKKRRRRRR
jgi:preprotein translocase subunit SecA